MGCERARSMLNMDTFGVANATSFYPAIPPTLTSWTPGSPNGTLWIALKNSGAITARPHARVATPTCTLVSKQRGAVRAVKGGGGLRTLGALLVGARAGSSLRACEPLWELRRHHEPWL